MNQSAGAEPTTHQQLVLPMPQLNYLTAMDAKGKIKNGAFDVRLTTPLTLRSRRASK